MSRMKFESSRNPLAVIGQGTSRRELGEKTGFLAAITGSPEPAPDERGRGGGRLTRMFDWDAAHRRMRTQGRGGRWTACGVGFVCGVFAGVLLQQVILIARHV